jgi:hypothetical protein
MAQATFEAISAALLGSAGAHERASPGLSYDVRLARGESISLATGENFAELRGYLRVYPDTDPRRREDKATGFIAYLEAQTAVRDSSPPSYLLQVWLPRVYFDELVSAARHGRIPSKMLVDIDGMEYDWRPNGRGKKWDNTESQHLKVDSFDFTLPLFLPPSTDEFQRSPSEEGMSPTRAQFDQLLERIDRQTAETNERLNGLFWLAIIVALVVLWFRWHG